MAQYIVANGIMMPEQDFSISPNTHGFRFGDGCFETIKVINGKIILGDYHFNRLFYALDLLGFSPIENGDTKFLTDSIKQLTRINGHAGHARVRLTVYRGDGNFGALENNFPNYIIQSWPGDEKALVLNQEGLSVEIFPDARIEADKYSPLKNSNYLRYVMGARWAKWQRLDDCLLINHFDRVVESSIANLFIVKEKSVITPPSNEGCVKGVMREYLMKCIDQGEYDMQERPISISDLRLADEVFLTNANFGIRWIKDIAGVIYKNDTIRLLHQKHIAPLFAYNNY